LNGPVPLAVSAQALSEVAVADCGCVAPTFSDQGFEKMYQVSHS
jgi:hypothetical protein